eukprot:NODE_1169_length_1914_cov_0.435262.p1 type:complete len:445 gc:universal NODE_1169_length_1914_cov_0.435262:446-1780(+)
MSHRRSTRNGSNQIRGPTSALTSFLRSKGIVARNINAYGRVNSLSEPEEILFDIPEREVRYSKCCLKCFIEIPKYYERKSINLCNKCAEDVKNLVRIRSATNTNKLKSIWKIPDEFLVLKEKPEEFPSLIVRAIKVLIENIDSVEDVGLIPDSALKKVFKLVCRYRKLDSRVLRILLNPLSEEIYLPDCNQLSEADFHFVINSCENAEKIEISFASQLRNGISLFSKFMPSLTQLTIHGAYLASDAEWASLFRGMNCLISVKLYHASKFSKLACESLVKLNNASKKVIELALTDTNHLDGECLTILSALSTLETLNLSNPFHMIETEAWVDLLKAVGPNLRELVLNSCSSINDVVLLQGISPFCVSLNYLSLENADISDESLLQTFDSFQTHVPNHQFHFLSFQNCHKLSHVSIISILRDFGSSLEYLNINVAFVICHQMFLLQ